MLHPPSERAETLSPLCKGPLGQTGPDHPHPPPAPTYRLMKLKRKCGLTLEETDNKFMSPSFSRPHTLDPPTAWGLEKWVTLGGSLGTCHGGRQR